MAFLAVQPVVYLVAWILLHVKGARENRAFIYPLYAFESMLSQYTVEILILEENDPDPLYIDFLRQR